MIPENAQAKFIKLHPRGFAEYTYPQFQNSQEFALDGVVIFFTYWPIATSLMQMECSINILVFNMSLAFEMKTFCMCKVIISKSHNSQIVPKCEF